MNDGYNEKEALILINQKDVLCLNRKFLEWSGFTDVSKQYVDDDGETISFGKVVIGKEIPLSVYVYDDDSLMISYNNKDEVSTYLAESFLDYCLKNKYVEIVDENFSWSQHRDDIKFDRLCKEYLWKATCTTDSIGNVDWEITNGKGERICECESDMEFDDFKNIVGSHNADIEEICDRK